VGCLLVLVFLAFPRIALVLLFLFSNFLERAFHGLLLPLLGFLLVPLTTLVYAWMVNTRQPVAGINLLILIVTVVIDLGGLSGGEYHRRRRAGRLGKSMLLAEAFASFKIAVPYDCFGF
jgi:hypothetical protein